MTDSAGLATPTGSPLPFHGPIGCRRCWGNSGANVLTTGDGRFRVVNDPGAWGSSRPKILVLGISKGFTQVDAFAAGNFDEVPFKDCRDRLNQSLSAIGILTPGQSVDPLMKSDETTFGWGSLVRCSLSGWNKKQKKFMAGTPEVLPGFRHPEIQRFVQGCMKQYLSVLPQETKLVVLLGNDNKYIDSVAKELDRVYGPRYCRMPPVAHMTDRVLWVHTGHPSRGNGHLTEFLKGDGTTGQSRKREKAAEAIRKHLPAHALTDG